MNKYLDVPALTDSLFKNFFDEELAKHIDEFKEYILVEGEYKIVTEGMLFQSVGLHPNVKKFKPDLKTNTFYNLELNTDPIPDPAQMKPCTQLDLRIEPSLNLKLNEITCKYSTRGIYYPSGKLASLLEQASESLEGQVEEIHFHYDEDGLPCESAHECHECSSGKYDSIEQVLENNFHYDEHDSITDALNCLFKLTNSD